MSHKVVVRETAQTTKVQVVHNHDASTKSDQCNVCNVSLNHIKKTTVAKLIMGCPIDVHVLAFITLLVYS